MNSIIWNGVSSTTIQGLLISELPPITKPEMRITETVIDGRDGSIIEELGYSAYEKTVLIGLYGNFDINKVIKYFTGEGDVIFSNEPDKIYKAKICGKIDYTRLLRYRQASITFKVQPFKYKLNEYLRETQTATASGTNLVLKDSGATPMQITTEAEEVIIHGKNLFDNKSLELNNNTSIEVQEDGYKVVVKGGKQVAGSTSYCRLPLAMCGKTYCFKCDNIESATGIPVKAQIHCKTSSGSTAYNLNQTQKKVIASIPTDATLVTLYITPNNTDKVLAEDNTFTLLGLMITSVELQNDDWCAFDGLQTLEVVDGVVNCDGYEPTIISNADNLDMSVEYYKAFEVFNEGLENSKPLMILKGSGTVEISVNGVGVFSYTFPEGENEVYIDSEKEDAYLGSVLKNRNMNGEFPVLIPKTNKIEWSGDIESISILPRSRWL